ncbi:MAG: hypothetical protein WC549_08815 [Actinomycetota bacterium]
MDYTLIFGPTGSKLKEIQEKITNIDANNIICLDIEHCLKHQLSDTKKALKKVNQSIDNPKMLHITWYLPIKTVRGLWNQAFEYCLANLRGSDKPIKILLGHLIYYSDERKEFYSPINMSNLNNDDFNIKNLILLIDDIYDIFYKLTKENELYDIDLLGEYLQTFLSGIKVKPEIFFNDKEKLSSVCMGWYLKILSSIIYWRHTEMVFSETVAKNLNARFILYGVKQLTEALVNYIDPRNSNSFILYLSHIISEARRKFKNGNWPEFVENQINLIQELLKDQCLLIMPTAIDELRFQEDENLKNDKTYNDIKYNGKLNSRWPLIKEYKERTLFIQPEDLKDIEHVNIITPKYWNFGGKEKIVEYNTDSNYIKISENIIINILIQEIENQISSRDHQIVSNVDGLLIYRPLCLGKVEFSSGVDSEKKSFEDQVNSGIEKKSAFIHFYDDIKEFVKKKGEDKLQEEIINAKIMTISDKYKIKDFKLLENIVRKKTRKKLLTSGGIDIGKRKKIKEELEDENSSINIESLNLLLRNYLTEMIFVESEYASIWVFDSFMDFKNSLNNIICYFKGKNKDYNNWDLKKIKDIFKFSL